MYGFVWFRESFMNTRFAILPWLQSRTSKLIKGKIWVLITCIFFNLDGPQASCVARIGDSPWHGAAQPYCIVRTLTCISCMVSLVTHDNGATSQRNVFNVHWVVVMSLKLAQWGIATKCPKISYPRRESSMWAVRYIIWANPTFLVDLGISSTLSFIWKEILVGMPITY